MAPRLKVTEEDLENLTEAELAGMRELQAEEEAERLAAADEEGEGEGDIKAAADPKEQAQEPEKKEEKKEDEKPEGEEEGDAEDAGEAEGEGEEGDEGEGEEEDDGEGEKQPEKGAEKEAETSASSGRPLPPYQMTAEEIARLAAVEKELDAIAEKFDDGELTAKEMREQQKELGKELDDLKDKRTIAKMHGADASTRWYGQTIPAFLADHPEYVKGSLRFSALDTAVKQLQAASTDPTDPNILVEAHKRITDELGSGQAAQKPGEKPGNGRTIPPTLSNVPTSDITDTAHKSEFAHLDRLKGEAFERAVAKLTLDARERYLMGG